MKKTFACTVRDTKREGMVVGGTNRTHKVNYDIEIGKDDFLKVWSPMAQSIRASSVKLLP